MSTQTQRVIEVGDRLSGQPLATVEGGLFNLRMAPHDSSIVIFPHPSCDECLAYLRRLEALAGTLANWGGRPLAVVDDDQAAKAWDRELTLAVLVDREAGLRTLAGIASGQAAVLVADRFGTVYRAEWPGAAHGFPADEDLIDEVRYIGTQCPECGVPDDPLRGEESWAL